LIRSSNEPNTLSKDSKENEIFILGSNVSGLTLESTISKVNFESESSTNGEEFFLGIINRINDEKLKVGNVNLNTNKLPFYRARSLFEALKNGATERVTLHLSSKQQDLLQFLPLLIYPQLELIQIVSVVRDSKRFLPFIISSFPLLEGFTSPSIKEGKKIRDVQRLLFTEKDRICYALLNF
jgi:hypothetical protein